MTKKQLPLLGSCPKIVPLVESRDTINVSIAEPHTAARQDEVFYSFVWTANTNLSEDVPVPLTI